MTFYQELQLNQAGSKEYIASFDKPKDKFLHILIFIFKVVLNLAFCIAFMTAMTYVFGAENSIPSLVALLGILTFRFTDLDIRASQSVGGIFLIFLIFAFGPKLANLVPIGCDFGLNFVFLLLIVILGCHNVNFFNHAILVLSYVLLYGSDVSGFSYVKRLLCLLLGAVLTSAVLFRNKRKTQFKYEFKDLFKDFSLSNDRSRWQIKISFCVAGAILLSSIIGLNKPIWAGIAAMSVTVPFGKIRTRVKGRILGNIIGSLIFIVLYYGLPHSFVAYLSMIGGIGAGLSAKYKGQTAWNSFSSMSVAVMSLSFTETVFNRILNNILGAIFALIIGFLLEQILLLLNKQIQKRKLKKQVSAPAQIQDLVQEQIQDLVQELEVTTDLVQESSTQENQVDQEE